MLERGDGPLPTQAALGRAGRRDGRGGDAQCMETTHIFAFKITAGVGRIRGKLSAAAAPQVRIAA